MKRKMTNIFLAIGLLIGLSFLLYPTVSDTWNAHHQTQVIENYNDEIENLSDTQSKKLITDAQTYNEKLRSMTNRWNLSEQDLQEYDNILNIGSSGIMGYIEIEKINVKVAIYHGTDDSVLQIGAGHLEGSSMPVGGEGTHSVLMAHRGLMSAKLFTDLDKMQEGDTFTINVLGETMTYEVYAVRTVEPDDLADLTIEKDRDLCTLVTCTPYGINTHRLLVQGIRIENQTKLYVSSEAIVIDSIIVTFVVLVPVLLIIFLIFMILPNRKISDAKRKEIAEILLDSETKNIDDTDDTQ